MPSGDDQIEERGCVDREVSRDVRIARCRHAFLRCEFHRVADQLALSERPVHRRVDRQRAERLDQCCRSRGQLTRCRCRSRVVRSVRDVGRNRRLSARDRDDDIRRRPPITGPHDEQSGARDSSDDDHTHGHQCTDGTDPQVGHRGRADRLGGRHGRNRSRQPVAVGREHFVNICHWLSFNNSYSLARPRV